MKNKFTFFALLLFVLTSIGFAQPTVTTTAISSITTTSASSGGEVTSIGASAVTARGVCWDIVSNPGIADAHTTDGNGIGVFTSSITPLHAGTTYHVRAYATNTQGTSYGADVSFTTLTAAPTLTAPANGLTGVSVLPTLTWGSVVGAVTYKLYIANNVGFSDGGVAWKYDLNVGAVLTYNTLTKLLTDALYNHHFPLTNGGTYYWKVAAVNASGEGTASSISHFTTAPAITVNLNYPTGTLYAAPVTFSWNTGTSTTGLKFIVQYKNSYNAAPANETFWSGDSLTTLSSTESLSKSGTVLLGKTYYWRVLVQRTSNSEYVYYPAANVYGTFTTDGGASVTLTPSNPTGGSTIYTNTPQLSWTVSGTTTNLKYQVAYVKGGTGHVNGTGLLDDGANLSYLPSSDPASFTTNQYLLLPPLLPGATYYWQVHAYYTTNGSYSAWTTPISFTVSGTGTLVDPIPSYPIDDATVYTNSPDVYWYLDQAGSGLTFQVRYGKEKTGNDVSGTYETLPVAIGAATGAFYKNLPGLDPGTTYYWQVRSYSATLAGLVAIPADAYTSWTPVESFITNGVGTLQEPVASYPAGAGATVYTTNPTLYWYLNTAASGLYYEVSYTTDGNAPDDFAELFVDSPDQLSVQLFTLVQGQTVKWKVRSKNVATHNPALTANKSNYSDVATFVVAGGLAETHTVLTWPVGDPNPTIYTNEPTLYWYLEGSSLGLGAYTLKYKQNSAPNDWAAALLGAPSATQGQTTVSLATSFYTLPELTYGKHYYWAVATSDGASAHANYSQGDFTVVGLDETAAPILSQPANTSTVSSTSVSFSWFVNGSTTGITSYTLEYSNLDVFPDGGVTTVPINPPIQTKTVTLASGATYYWRVRANYGNGNQSAWSSPWSFTINTGAPTIVQPFVGGPNNVTVNTLSPILSWAMPAPSTANSTYEVQISENPNLQGARTISSTSSNKQIDGLVGGKSYFWNVRLRDASGNTSNYSSMGQFKVMNGATAVEDKNGIPTAFALSQNYPNPFNPSTQITYALPQNSYVSIKVYDMLGREVKTLVNNEVLAGNHSVTWNGDDNNGMKVVSGVYLYKINAGNFVKTMKLILMK